MRMLQIIDVGHKSYKVARCRFTWLKVAARRILRRSMSAALSWFFNRRSSSASCSSSRSSWGRAQILQHLMYDR